MLLNHEPRAVGVPEFDSWKRWRLCWNSKTDIQLIGYVTEKRMVPNPCVSSEISVESELFFVGWSEGSELGPLLLMLSVVITLLYFD